jgi:hypothetical protein
MVRDPADVSDQPAPFLRLRLSAEGQRRNSHGGTVARCPLPAPPGQSPVGAYLQVAQGFERARPQPSQPTAPEPPQEGGGDHRRVSAAGRRDGLAGRQGELRVISQPPLTVPPVLNYLGADPALKRGTQGVTDCTSNDAPKDTITK